MKASKAEQIVSRSLRTILAELSDGASIGDSEQFGVCLVDLEYFLPEILGEIYAEWRREGLDGVVPLMARKPRKGAAEILGIGIIVSDQSLHPLRLGLEIDPVKDEVTWLECRFGERSGEGLARPPYQELAAMSRRLRRLCCLKEESDGIAWFYKVMWPASI